jgi:hypothetical protein
MDEMSKQIWFFQLCEILFHKTSLLYLVSWEYLSTWWWAGLIHALIDNQKNGLIQGWNWILHEKMYCFSHRCMQAFFKSLSCFSFYLPLLRCNEINEIKFLKWTPKRSHRTCFRETKTIQMENLQSSPKTAGDITSVFGSLTKKSRRFGHLSICSRNGWYFIFSIILSILLRCLSVCYYRLQKRYFSTLLLFIILRE